MNYFRIVLVFIFIFSCKETKKSIGPDFFSDLDIENFSADILNNGDIVAYRNISTYFFQINDINKLLPYSRIMSDKYNYTQAYYDVYSCLRGANSNLDHLNKNEQKEALKYLIKAFERGHSQSKEVLQDYMSNDKYIDKIEDNFVLKKID